MNPVDLPSFVIFYQERSLLWLANFTALPHFAVRAQSLGDI